MSNKGNEFIDLQTAIDEQEEEYEVTVSTIFYTYDGAKDYEGMTLEPFKEWLKEHNKVRLSENCDCTEDSLKEYKEHQCSAIEKEDEFTVYKHVVTLDDFNKYKKKDER